MHTNFFDVIRRSDDALNRAIVGITELDGWKNFDRDIMTNFARRLVVHKLDLTDKQREVARKRITFVYLPQIKILAAQKQERIESIRHARVDAQTDTATV